MDNINCSTPSPSPVDAEEWRAIPGYEKLYEVSNHGRVRSSCSRKGSRKGLILKPKVAKTGYLHIGLKNGGARTHLVHRLVAAAFIELPAVKMPVNHKDGNKANNRISNLEYVTAKENQQHASANNLLAMGDRNIARKNPHIRRGENSKHNILTTADALEAMRLMSEGSRVSDIARMFNVSYWTISKIKHGRNWKHLRTPEPNRS